MTKIKPIYRFSANKIQNYIFLLFFKHIDTSGVFKFFFWNGFFNVQPICDGFISIYSFTRVSII